VPRSCFESGLFCIWESIRADHQAVRTLVSIRHQNCPDLYNTREGEKPRLLPQLVLVLMELYGVGARNGAGGVCGNEGGSSMGRGFART
jgi:hypothetical protein